MAGATLPLTGSPAQSQSTPRHAAWVRVTHWIAALAILLLLFTGGEIIVSHPRFYWGENGNPNTPSLFDIPIPASRPWVNTGYGYVLPDQNGWSRSLHFQAAWAIVITGLLYLLWGFRSRHFRHHQPATYNKLQRNTYMFVVFVLAPIALWTGLAMSPALVATFPFLVTSLGGHQTARTIHFFVSLALLTFFIGHVVMVIRTGFKNQMRAMITGQAFATKESQ